MSDTKRCPKCGGSDDIELVDPETAACGECGYEARPFAFDPEGEKL